MEVFPTRAPDARQLQLTYLLWVYVCIKKESILKILSFLLYPYSFIHAAALQSG